MTMNVENKEGISVKKLVYAALATALICISTMFIQVTIPLGYAHFGNTFILLSSYLFGKRVGAASAAVGSALADFLTGYAIWIIPTLIIKSIMGFVIGSLSNKNNHPKKVASAGLLAGAVISNAWMVVGYTFSGAILYGSLAAGLASTPGLILEGVVNIVAFYILAFILEKSSFIKTMTR
ncbi:ECF transporter S component [Parasporobacterium paucivorans]|uniref:Uncharacterized membrane protein n=1 Tax=Parasporobacterium paucivorans DSM 15970 TaxID=1122934 RepID=A0A1M6AJC1_9FIRM|nr:ECF transporter S component [Parasporobacterium paucivorans]SHI36562.1 Uncharacterized membrane protein [Parasporobacterium paucivorans DSM 15970]